MFCAPRVVVLEYDAPLRGYLGRSLCARVDDYAKDYAVVACDCTPVIERDVVDSRVELPGMTLCTFNPYRTYQRCLSKILLPFAWIPTRRMYVFECEQLDKLILETVTVISGGQDSVRTSAALVDSDQLWSVSRAYQFDRNTHTPRGFAHCPRTTVTVVQVSPIILSTRPAFALMSHSRATTSVSSSSSFQLIINNALKAYEKRTKKDLLAHPLASQLQACDSPEDILTVLQQQVRGVGQSQSADERWTKWLVPTVNVLFAFSATLGSGVGLVCSGKCGCLRSASLYLLGRYSHPRA